MANSYLVFNGPLATGTSPTPVTTSAVLKTLLQICPALPIEVVEWGISFDETAVNTPGTVELIDVNAAATVTLFSIGDVQPYNDPNAPANTAGVSGTPLNLGTTASGYTAGGEGSITASGMLDLQLLSPTLAYIKQFPLGERPKIAAGRFLRVRVKFGTAVNALCYVVFSV